MPVTIGSIRSALKFLCIVCVPLAAACGGSSTETAKPAAPPPGPPPAGIALTVAQINVPLTAPLFVTAPRGDTTGRLFVLEQAGRIQIVHRDTGALIGTFLDISGEVVRSEFENGLLGLAFDPNYDTNGRFYVSYTDANSNIVLARYLRNPVNPNQALPIADRILMTTATRGQHFGGMLAFDRDGRFLYISRGDGGSADPEDPAAADPDNNGQNLGTVLGKILRIDVSQATQVPAPEYDIPPDNPYLGQPGARGEIWSTGLRNPWRFSFDRATGDIYIADVGEGRREQINVSTVASGAGRASNFGWKIMEGTLCFSPMSGCDRIGLTEPTLEYAHSAGACSVTGGYVYRGTNPALAALRGTYFYSDFCGGFVRSFRFVNGAVTQHAEWASLAPQGMVTSFGEDADGELYIVTQFPNGLFRIVQQ